MSKKKTNSTGSLKGFILLIILVAGVLYFCQNKDNSTISKHLQQQMKEVVDNTSQQLEKETPETEVDKRTISQLEIPVTIKKRNEIRLNRTGFTISYNNFYKVPNWVAWELTRQETTGNEERKSKFLPDPICPNHG